MQIVCAINYWSDCVTTFDPEKVIARLQVAFPEAEVDPTDQSAAEVERIRQFVESRTEADAELRERYDVLMFQAQCKARRNGPVFTFRIADIQGAAGRYRVWFHCGAEIHPSVRKRIVAFLKSLELGTVTVSDTDGGLLHRSVAGRRWWKFW